MDRSTVGRILNIFHQTGEVSKKEYPKEQAFRKLTEPAQFLILKLVVGKPGIYLKEIQNEVLLQLVIDVNISTIYRFFEKQWFQSPKNATSSHSTRSLLSPEILA